MLPSISSQVEADRWLSAVRLSLLWWGLQLLEAWLLLLPLARLSKGLVYMVPVLEVLFSSGL